jgi:hypothetical protein
MGTFLLLLRDGGHFPTGHFFPPTIAANEASSSTSALGEQQQERAGVETEHRPDALVQRVADVQELVAKLDADWEQQVERHAVRTPVNASPSSVRPVSNRGFYVSASIGA